MLHHYTAIQTLALILDSKRIRFTRIDLVDDIKETEGLPNDIKTNAFVSCWTEDDSENLPLWSLYTQMNGVRISLPADMFNKYSIKAGDYGNWGYTKDVIVPLPLEKIRTDEYLILNPFWLNDGFYKKVIYSDDYIEYRKKMFNKTDKVLTIVTIQNLFSYKDSIWSFQKEGRFYLIVFPLPPLTLFKDRETQMKNMYYNSPISNSLPLFIDVDLNIDVLNNISVRLNPTCSNADRIIVQSLLDKYTTNGKMEDSVLQDTYRGKK